MSRPNGRLRAAGALAALLALQALFSGPAGASPPEEGDCPTVSGASAKDPAARDASPVTLREGMVLTLDDLLVLKQLVPKEIWGHRQVFFHEGMRMEIGPCHRRYPVPGFFREATERFAGKASLDKKGNLRGYTAGLPFPPASIDLEAKDAALRWAWNMQQRFRGGGHRGSFRLVDFPGRTGGVMTYEGRFFLLPTRGRADLAKQDYAVPGGDELAFAAGGRFSEPFEARHLAWRQFRPIEVDDDTYNESDDIFVYVPTMRKMRRASIAWVDGLYFPTYTVAGDSGGGTVPINDGNSTISPTAGLSIAVTQNAYRGFEGLVLRPNAYLWRHHGERDVLAPLNATREGYPDAEERNFGESGLSVASDRWEVRRAIVIEGALRRDDEAIRTVTYYLDWQTQQPLYRFTRAGKRRLLDIQIYVHRFSGDDAEYPEWPGGVPAMVFDPVAQVSYSALDNAGGWRRESYDILSLPFDASDTKRMLSAAPLDRGR